VDSLNLAECIDTRAAACAGPPFASAERKRVLFSQIQSQFGPDASKKHLRIGRPRVGHPRAPFRLLEKLHNEDTAFDDFLVEDIAADGESCVTFLNPVAERMTGWKAMTRAGAASASLLHRQRGYRAALARRGGDRVCRQGQRQERAACRISNTPAQTDRSV
jgi:PAS domain-containing protein